MNISIGGSSSSSTLQNAVNYAWSKGAVVIACAQNYSTSIPYYPAACANVVAVSATTSSDTLASFSNYGDWVDISAPGASILTTNRGGGYGSWNGTSFSSPIVAGVAALMLSANPFLTNVQVVDLLTHTADDLGASGYDPYFGYGRVNVYQSLLAARAVVPEPDDTIDPSVAITSPWDGAAISNRVTIQASASDDTGISRMELFVDDVLKAVKTKSALRWNWNTRKVTNGPHTITVKAFDAAGNEAIDTITVYK
jgi:subtilisin family serine protease